MKIFQAYNGHWPRPNSRSPYIKVVSDLPLYAEILLNPFEGNNPPGLKITSSQGRIYYLNGNKQVYLTNEYGDPHLNYMIYVDGQSGILLNLITDSPILFRKVLYPEWPFVI